jgi:hypothetical protein
MPAEEHVDANKVKGCVSQARSLRVVRTVCGFLLLVCVAGGHGSAAGSRAGAGSSSMKQTMCLLVQVWVVAEMHDDKKLYWRADSDSELTKAGFAHRPSVAQTQF